MEKNFPLNASHADRLLDMLEKTCEDEIDCSTVFQHLDNYADFILLSGEKSSIMWKIEEHLKVCGNCAEEFNLLLKALKYEG